MFELRQFDLNGVSSELRRFLMKTSLNTMPSLIQVLTGEASLVGRRPRYRSTDGCGEAADRDGPAPMKPGLVYLSDGQVLTVPVYMRAIRRCMFLVWTGRTYW